MASYSMPGLDQEGVGAAVKPAPAECPKAELGLKLKKVEFSEHEE